MKGVLIGMGNPLLDATITVDDEYLKKYQNSLPFFFFSPLAFSRNVSAYCNILFSFIFRYDLTSGNAILAEKKHDQMYISTLIHFFHHFPSSLSFFLSLNSYVDLMERDDCKFGAGGAALNTIRAAQWMLQVEGASGYVGCVGDDKSAKILEYLFLKG